MTFAAKTPATHHPGSTRQEVRTMVPETRPFRDVTADEMEAAIHGFHRKLEGLRADGLKFKTTAHEGVERSVEAAKARVDGLLDSANHLLAANQETVIPTGLADAWVLATDPRVAELWHQRIDAAGSDPHVASPFATLDRPEYEARKAELTGAIAERERELRIRAAEQDRDRAAAELAQLGGDDASSAPEGR